MLTKTCGRTGRITRAAGLALALSVSLSGCTTISDWFVDDEELEIRRLAPLDAQFVPTVNWEAEVGEGIDSYFSHLRPVYANEKLYVADRHGQCSQNPEQCLPFSVNLRESGHENFH